ncbi:MAG: ABC transporter ATP-binding protein [Mesorhizobium sp.]
MSEVLLRAKGLSKEYPARGSRGAVLARMLFGLGGKAGGHRAVDDVSLELSKGECLGIVGRNGAGKSTLLRMLCGITAPDKGPDGGHVECVARIAPMLELGAGFRPDFTGRENVLINAALYGMDTRTARERLDPIREFSGMGDYFDRPMREYSSGMRARLAFSVAAHVDADILVVDELLGVGDAAFQQKCRRFIRAFLERGAVILVSHDDSLLLSSATRAMWLDKGRALASGDTGDVLLRYRASFIAAQAEPASAGVGSVAGPRLEQDVSYGGNPISISGFRKNAPVHGIGDVRIDDVHFENMAGERLSAVQGTDEVELVLSGEVVKDSESLIAGFILRDEAGQNLFGDNSFETYRLSPRDFRAGERFEARFRFRLPYLPAGIYILAPSIIAGTQSDHVHQCWIEEAVVLTAASSPLSFGKIGVAYGGTISSTEPSNP